MVTDAAKSQEKAEPAPFTQEEVISLGRGTLSDERAGRILELHRPSDNGLERTKSTKLGPAELDEGELGRAATGAIDEDIETRFIEAGKRDRNRKRAVAKGATRPRLRPPSERRKRK